MHPHPYSTPRKPDLPRHMPSTAACGSSLRAGSPHYCYFMSTGFLIGQISLLCFSNSAPCGRENILCIISVLFN